MMLNQQTPLTHSATLRRLLYEGMQTLGLDPGQIYRHATASRHAGGALNARHGAIALASAAGPAALLNCRHFTGRFAVGTGKPRSNIASHSTADLKACAEAGEVLRQCAEAQTFVV